MENLISVIVVTYNQEDTIGRALDSILMQQCHLPLEIVIGEDCSTDSTRSICQKYAEQYPDVIRLFANDHNKGVVDNYFDCLLACRGKFIADCAGDDFWVDELKLEKASRLMEDNDRITLVHTAWRYYNEYLHVTTASPQQPFPERLTNGKEMLEAIVTQTNMPVIHLCTSLYRTETILKEYHAHTELFRDSNWGCEDLQIAFFMAKDGLIAYLPDVTLHYSQGKETISGPKDEKKMFRFFLRVTSLSYRLAQDFHIQGKRVDTFFSRRSFTLLMHAFRAHDKALRQEAIDCCRQWGAQTTCTYKVVKMVTSNDLLWSLALQLRKQFR